MRKGDKVIINDYSEAHGDIGTILDIDKYGQILVELDEYDSCWPVDGEHELLPYNKEDL